MEHSHKELSSVANSLIDAFESQEIYSDEPKIQVNRFVSELASWYEKIRNAMDYRDDEVVLRAAIERILKRRHLYGGTGRTIAEPLLRELVWARYFPNDTLSQNLSEKISDIIDLYLHIKKEVGKQKIIPENELNEWIYQLISCHIARFLKPNQEKNIVSNFMFHILRDVVTIEDDSEDTKNVQVYLAVRRSFARDDLAFLRFYLFQQIYGDPSKENINHIVETFTKGYQEINRQLNYKLKEKILVFIKKQTPVFFILEDILRERRGKVRHLLKNHEEWKQSIYGACEVRYRGISSKVRRAIIRSVIFLLLTKVVFAYVVEGTYDKLVYGKLMWESLIINVGVPPILMVIVSLFIKTPGRDNSERIFHKINTVLYDEHPKISPHLRVALNPKRKNSMNTIFGILWFAAFFFSFGLMYNILARLGFDIVSKGIFMFFVAIVSFLSYRINKTAHMYTIDDKQGMLTPFIDFLFLPMIRVGMKLTEGVSKINVFIFIFDFLIEAPFKGIFSFFEQWFLYMHTKREDLE